jgi:uncharacterized protein YdcH (DUF465 family)
MAATSPSKSRASLEKDSRLSRLIKAHAQIYDQIADLSVMAMRLESNLALSLLRGLDAEAQKLSARLSWISDKIKTLEVERKSYEGQVRVEREARDQIQDNGSKEAREDSQILLF